MEIAILLASGKGTRMRPITETTPKPLFNMKGGIKMAAISPSTNLRLIKNP